MLVGGGHHEQSFLVPKENESFVVEAYDIIFRVFSVSRYLPLVLFL